MTQEVSELLKKALNLPPEARAALAGSLLESLDTTVDASAEEAWSHEIARRIEELDSAQSDAYRVGRGAPANFRHPQWPLKR